MVVGSALASLHVVCVLQQSQWLYFRWKVNPIFGNKHAILADQALTATGGAALDVHVIADNWNSSRLDVLCGYSSQLHSLTNIPIRIDGPRILRWSCRLLALVLILQAALLASIPNSTDADQWSGALWLLMYSLMSFIKNILQYIYPKTLLEKQPASVEYLEPIHFSGRMGALLFIAMLPVSQKAERWAWLDVYMPDNNRRRTFQRESEAVFYALETEKEDSMVKIDGSTQQRLLTSNPALLETLSATKRVEFVESLKAFKKIVRAESTQTKYV
jgi:hypothetical protein